MNLDRIQGDAKSSFRQEEMREAMREETREEVN